METALDVDGARRLVLPRSLAIVGASPARAELIENVLAGGLPAWGVHPTREAVGGLVCRPSVADLPELPEVAVLLVGHDRVEQAFADAVAAGVRALIVPGLGAESGAAGRAIVTTIAAQARDLGAALLGPNCMGVIVPGGGSPYLSAVPASVLPGSVAVVAQSGSIADSLRAIGRRIGFRCIVSSGGEAVTDAADLLAFLAADEETRAIGLFLETVRRPAAFAEALGRCAEAGKPVACLKVGRSQAGSRVALAHTGALVGSHDAFSALLEAYGAIEVDDFPVFVETLELLGRTKRPRGRRVGAVSESGGEAALLADRGEAAGLPFPALSATLAQQLETAFPNFVAATNPLDAWAIDDADRVYPGSFQAMASSGEFDVLLAQVDLSRFRGDGDQGWCRMIVESLIDAVDRSPGTTGAVISTHTTDPPDWAFDLARSGDVALLRGPGDAMRALSAVTAWSPRRPTRAVRGAPVELDDLLRPGALPEHESALVLERYGVQFAARRRCPTEEDVRVAVSEFGGTVVVKSDGPSHKARSGGVVLGLDDPDDAVEAARRIGFPVLVARQIEPGREVFLGMTRDPHYGPMLAVGSGGGDVEVSGDVAIAIAPVDEDGARRLLASSGQPQDDRLAAWVVALGRVAAHHPSVLEAELNPILLTVNGPIAVDALVVVADGT